MLVISMGYYSKVNMDSLTVMVVVSPPIDLSLEFERRTLKRSSYLISVLKSYLAGCCQFLLVMFLPFHAVSTLLHKQQDKNTCLSIWPSLLHRLVDAGCIYWRQSHVSTSKVSFEQGSPFSTVSGSIYHSYHSLAHGSSMSFQKTVHISQYLTGDRRWWWGICFLVECRLLLRQTAVKVYKKQT